MEQMLQPEEIVEVSAQVVVDQMTGELHHEERGRVTFEKMRTMRRDGVIALARKVSIAPTLMAEWTIEADPEWEWLRQVIDDQLTPIRGHLLRTALGGVCDFGWKAYEKVFRFEEPNETFASYGDVVPPQLLILDHIRPLKNDYTWVRYNKWNGKFMGLAHTDQYIGQKYYIDAQHSLFINFDEEGLGEYGEADMTMVEPAYDSWNDCNDAAKRYDRKMSGAFLLCKYRVGKTEYNGAKVDNALIAKELIKAMQASGAVAIPCEEQRVSGGGDASAWKEMWSLEFINPPALQADFTTRLMYLDKLKARAFKVTERSIFEGEFGTKADASAHADAMLMVQHLKHVGIVELLNWHIVNQLCIANGGPAAENAVKIVAHPLADDARDLFVDILTSLLKDPGRAAEMLDKIDDDALLRELKIPIKPAYEDTTTGMPTFDGSDWRDQIAEIGLTNEMPVEPVGPPWWAPDVTFFDDKEVELSIDGHSYSCVMAMLPEGVAEHVWDLALKIDPDDLAGSGIEEEPHVTVKYGLHTNDPANVQKVLGTSSPAKLQLLDVGCFYALENPGPKPAIDPMGSPVQYTPKKQYSGSAEYDVLKVGVYSDCLRKLNAKLVGALPFTDSHAVYSPHVTIAYVKPGTAAKYVEQFKDALNGLEVILRDLVFSNQDNKYTTIDLNGDQTVSEGGLSLGNSELSFCPGGAGAGVDPSCGSSGGGGKSESTGGSGKTARLKEKLSQIQARNAASRQELEAGKNDIAALTSKLAAHASAHEAAKAEVVSLRSKIKAAEGRIRAAQRKMDKEDG